MLIETSLAWVREATRRVSRAYWNSTIGKYVQRGSELSELSNPPIIHTPGPSLPPELNHDLLSQIGWLIGDESDAVLRWHRRLKASNPIDRTWDDYWDVILGILNHSAVLSRAFWPATNPHCSRACCRDEETAADRAERERMKARGEFFRTLFNVEKDSPLNEDGRRARNTIEHWDQRVHKLSGEISAAKGGYKLWIGSLKDVPAGSYPVRAYDPDADLIACGQTRMPLLPLVTEARRIESRYSQVVGFLAHGEPIWSHAVSAGGQA